MIRHPGFLLAALGTYGDPVEPRVIADEEFAFSLMNALNRAQREWDGTEPWRVFPIAPAISNHPGTVRNRKYPRKRAS